MIRLIDSEGQIRNLLREGLLSFEEQHPDVCWSFLGLDATIIYGSVAVNFDTKECNDAIQKAYPNVASFCAKAIDSAGRYNNNCVDFKFASWRKLTIDAWHDQYFNREKDEPLIILYPNGTEIRLESGCGDESVNEAVFPFFLELLRSEIPFILENSKHRNRLCRVGVQMCDSDCVDFWLL